MKLDKIQFQHTGGGTVNPNTQQELKFCARQPLAAGLALSICPEHPGTAS